MIVETPPYATIRSGELAGSLTATQFPSLTARMVLVRAVSSNVGNVYIGGAGVTKADGVTDTTTGYQLGPGDSTPWLPIANLNQLYYICDNAGDDLVYLVLA